MVWECAYRRRRPLTRPSRDQHQQALGTVELAIRESGALDSAQDRDRWRTIDGHIDLDWRGGPFAHEVVGELVAYAEDPHSGTVDPGQLLPGINLLGELNAVWLNDLRVRFRPYQPIGAKLALEQMWAAMSERRRGSAASEA
ncbi:MULTISPECIES: hypothetical protein [Amycolatopsis]|uniref:Uncharacterized protein n=1 Tax=Amycolatopsis albidoflavus TaxID=102226 RepID=A0ABW5I9B5_9PSEU